MRKSLLEQNGADSGIIDLKPFGFDSADDAWLGTFRAAAIPEPLGQLGRYEILEEIGRGGQGIVYRARRRDDGRIFALKRLIRGAVASLEDRRRFERELRAIQMLDHAGVARAIDIENADGQPFIVMEFIEGEPLIDWARPGSGRLRVSEIVSIFADLCDAVHHAHVRGIIHRDLKPTNVLVVDSNDSADPRPVVLDFGMAQVDAAVHGHSFSGGQFVGTLAYAAPEQLDGVPGGTDARADVYSIGAMLYEALTGKPPIETDGTLAQAIRAIAESEPAWPSRVASGIARDLDAIALKALAKEKIERYQSVEAMAEDLRRLLSGDPVLARAPRSTYLVGKLVRRHPIGFAAGLAAMVGMTVLAGLLYGSRENERQAQAHANEARASATKSSEFLLEMLSTADASRGGADVTLVEVLEQAGKRIDPALSNRPAAAAAVHLSVGKTYSSLWKWNEALPHLEKAVELYRAVGDGESQELAKALSAYGRALTSVRDPRAVDVQREALALRRELYGEEHVEIAEGWKGLAYALQQAASPPDFEEAERCYEQALAMYRATVGEDDRETAGCLHSFGWMRVRQQRIIEAEALYREALNILRRIDKPTDSFYVDCLYGYTAQLAKLGHDAENVEALDELIPLLRDSHGSRSVILPMYMKARALRSLGEFDRAMAAHADALRQIFIDHDIDIHPSANAASDDGFVADALCDQLLQLAGETSEAATFSTLAATVELATTHREAGRLGRADAIFIRLEATIDANKLDAPIIASDVLAGRAAVASARGQHDDAISMMEQAISIIDLIEQETGLQRAMLSWRLSEIQEAAGDATAARESMSGVTETLRKQHGDEHRLTREAIAFQSQLG